MARENLPFALDTIPCVCECDRVGLGLANCVLVPRDQPVFTGGICTYHSVQTL